MITRRRVVAYGSLVLGAFFLLVAIAYWGGWYVNAPADTDYTGFVLLVALGVAISLVFGLLLRNSGDL